MSKDRKISRRAVIGGAGAAVAASSLPRVSVAQGADVAKAIEWAKANLPASTPEIIQGAAKEGKLVLTLQQFGTDETTAALIRKFRERYPFVNVTYTAQNGVQIMQKFSAEQSAKKGITDYLQLPSNALDVNRLIEQGALTPFLISQDSAFPDVAKGQKGYWYPWLRQHNATAYRKGALNEEEKKLVRTFKGLADPRFKGRLGILGANTSNALMGSYILQTDTDASLWQGLAANKPKIKASSLPMIDALLSGEFDIALMCGFPTAAVSARDGAPLEFVITSPSPIMYAPGAISSLAPNPNAAKLWQDWGMSKEGQDTWVSLVGVPSARNDVAKPWAEQQSWFFNDLSVQKQVNWADFAAKEKEVLGRYQKDLQGA